MNIEHKSLQDQIVLDFITKRYHFNSKKKKSKSLMSISETKEESQDNSPLKKNVNEENKILPKKKIIILKSVQNQKQKLQK